MSQFEEDGFSLWLEETANQIAEQRRLQKLAAGVAYHQQYIRWHRRLARAIARRLFTLAERLNGPPPPDQE